MRTTITLDADVAAKLKAESKKTGRPFKAVVNEYLRLGFTARQQLKRRDPFRVRARPLGLRAGVSIDMGELREQIDGPSHR